MEQKTSSALTTVISMVSATVSIVMDNLQTWISLGAGLVAIASGLMAIRHYYYSTKRIKEGK